MKFLAILTLSGFMLLGGCASLGTPEGRDAFIKQVQAIAAQACGFVPLAQTITAILTAGQFTEAFTIANAICSAVTAPPPPGATRQARVPMVSGVPVRGHFVTKR